MSFLSICPILLNHLTLRGSRDAAFGSDSLLLMHINMFQCMCCFNFNVGSEFYFSVVAGASIDLEHFKFLYIRVQALCRSDFQYI